jgi:predicted helicase
MHSAVAFYRDIKSSKSIKNEFEALVDEYLKSQSLPEEYQALECEVDHVDGTYNATQRNSLLS